MVQAKTRGVTAGRRRWLPSAALLGLLLAACSTVEIQSFENREGTRVDSAQVAVGADFSKYDRLQAADMGIFFPAGTTMQEADSQRLRQAFRDAFTAELSGYPISREPGATTLLVDASLIDLRGATGEAALSLRRDLRDLAQPGSLVFLMELRDSESGEVLARAADSAQAPVLGTSGNTRTDWRAVEQAAAYWAMLFREFLDNNLGQPRAAP